MELPSKPPSTATTSTTEVTEEKQRGLETNEITRLILRSAFKVHTAIGPGVFERVYHLCLFHEIKKAGLSVESELVLPIVYGDLKIDAAYRVDLCVEKRVLVEVKAVETVLPVHRAQVLSYLQLSGLHVGLLLNFNVEHLLQGITRLVR